MTSYTHCSAESEIPCTEQEYRALAEALNLASVTPANEGGMASNEVVPEGEEPHGYQVSFSGHSIHLFAPEEGTTNNLPDAALEIIGNLLLQAKMDFVEIGISIAPDSAHRFGPGSHAGLTARIYNNGHLVWPTLNWEDPRT